MKKLLLIFATFCCFAAQAAVNEIVDVEFTVEIVNNGPVGVVVTIPNGEIN